MIESKLTIELRPHSLNVDIYGEGELGDEFLQSVAEVGILTPLSILPDGTIISGHRRWRAAQELGLATVPVRVLEVEGDLAIKRALIESNRQREKTFSQKMREAEVLEEIEREKAKRRQATSTGGAKPQLVDARPQAEGGKSRDAVAEAVGIGSGRQYSRAKKIWEPAQEGDERARELVKKLDDEEITISGAVRELDSIEVKDQRKQAVEVIAFSSESNEYYTPSQYIEAARCVMGDIDLDPASHPRAQEIVDAVCFYTKDEDGLNQDWHGCVWLNPPYGKSGGESNQGLWAQHLKEQYESENVEQAVLLVKAAVGYKWFERLWDIWPVCFARERISFIRSDGDDKGQSKQGTAFFYLGDNVERFIDVFGQFGRVILPEDQRGDYGAL